MSLVALAGQWAWASFLLAGAVALLASLSYVALATKWRQGGGLYGFLTRLGHGAAAGSVAWVLVAGYVLTMAVYAFTFGHYLANVLGVDAAIWARVFAVAVVAALVLINLRGVGDAQRIEEITVWGKLAVLLGLGTIGLFRFEAANLSPPGANPGIDSVLLGVVIGAAAIFMAYEGFQLLTYDYDDIRSPERTLPRAVPRAVAVVTGVYILVALGAVSLVGAQLVIDQKESRWLPPGRPRWARSVSSPSPSPPCSARDRRSTPRCSPLRGWRAPFQRTGSTRAGWPIATSVVSPTER